MTRTNVTAIAFAFSALFAGQAMAAADGPITRDQVKAELAEAVRTGNIVTGESSAKQNEKFPQLYPEQQSVDSKSRAEVRSELAEAAANGWIDRHIEA